MQKLLVVDDEPNVLYSLEKGLKSDGYAIVTAATAKQGVELVRATNPDVVLLDVRLPDMSGLEAFDRMRNLDPRLPVIVMTAHGTTETAIEAMKRGAFEYLLKPVKLNELRQIVSRAIEVSRLSRVPAVFDHEDEPAAADRIIGNSAVMQRVYKDIGRVAGQDVNILILGESGTGKELVARAIFHHSARSHGPFLAINAAAIPEALLESELFGHERGSFTGADRKRVGKFEQANGGTLFLDEIGDMPIATQAKVLRVLQDGRFERVGGNESIQTDVRVIAATNQNLEKLIEEARFRQDLYYRLKVFTIELPPLRQRLEDLDSLLDHFIKIYNRELGKQLRSPSSEIVEMLCRYSWPGNVRELQSAVKYALIHARGSVLTPDCFPESCRTSEAEGADSHAPTAESGRRAGGFSAAPSGRSLDIAERFAQLLSQQSPDIYHTIEREVDRYLLTETLRLARGNQVEASRLLGISRTTLRAKIDALQLCIEKHVLTNSGHDGRIPDSL